MRVGNLFLLGSSIVALLAAIACNESTQRIVEEPDENEPGASTSTNKQSDSPTKGKTDDTCLGKASLAFDDTDCNTCMSDDAACCQATITCFKDDPDCAALHTCIQGCGGGGGNGDGGGGGNGDGGGGGNGNGRGDGGGGGGGNGTGGGDGGGGGNGTGGGDGGNGAACKEACKAQHPNALTKWQAYNTCAVVTCKAACL